MADNANRQKERIFCEQNGRLELWNNESQDLQFREKSEVCVEVGVSQKLDHTEN